MQQSTCPECGVPIGGGNHALLGTNTRDQEMERIATEVGGLRNPHAHM